MSQVGTLIIKIGLVVFGLFLLQACASKICNSQVNNELSKIDFFTQTTPFVLKDSPSGWSVSKVINQEVIESRYSYKIEIDPNSKLILLNHRKLSLDDVSKGLEKEFLEFLNKFRKEDLRDLPNVGFQVIYPYGNKGIDIDKISKTICVFVESIDLLIKKSKANFDLNEDKAEKLLQFRFSFFPQPPLRDSMSK